MQESMQKYIVFIKIAPGKGGAFWKDFSEMPDDPMKGVTVVSSYSMFGYWDFALIFKADSNDNALHFVGERLRALSGITDTSTTPLTVLKEHKKH